MDHSGTIEFTEWCIATIDKQLLLTTDRLRRAFNQIDEDRSGEISAAEIRRLFKIDRDDKEVDILIKKFIADANPEGGNEIEFEEFQDMMKMMIIGKK